jgi:hypothetical protein
MTQRTQQIGPLLQAQRVIVFSLNVLVFWAIFVFTSSNIFPTGSPESVWLISMISYWILSLVAAPYFSPPKDSLGTAISVLLLLIPLDLSNVTDYKEIVVSINYLAIGLATVVSISALTAILNKSNEKLSRIAYKISSTFGKGELLYTLAIIVSVLGFYQDSIASIFLIWGMWVFFVTARPMELATQLYLYLSNVNEAETNTAFVGSIVRIDDPNLVRVALNKGVHDWKTDSVHISLLPNGKLAHILPLFTQLHEDKIIGTGICCILEDMQTKMQISRGSVYSIQSENSLLDAVRLSLAGQNESASIAGIVVEGSTISEMRFQAVRGVTLEEGTVVFAIVGDKKVYYQILDAKTNEESFDQSPYGTHIVTASQIGIHNPDKGLQKFSWLPDMNQPVFLAQNETHEQNLASNEFLVGKVSGTNLGIPVVLDDIIHYHTAVLGVTGTGKTELALEIVRNAVGQNAKVFCVDFTGEYRHRLSDLNPTPIGLSIDQGSTLEARLFAVETGTFGAPAEKAALKAYLDEVKPQITSQIEAFLTSTTQKLGVFELNEITNSKATLRTTEMYLSAIMEWAKKNRRREKVMIVLEEAHTIIPEAYQSGFDADTQWVVSRIGQIALQGRKYGVGLMLVSQRTALVSKTILSQCNTYFTHALVDKTSLEYLAGVYGTGHIKAIPNLKFLEFIVHGKAVKSDLPLLGKMDFDKDKLDASKAMDYVAIPTVVPAVVPSDFAWTEPPEDLIT